MTYIDRLRRDLELAEGSLGIGLHFSHSAAVRLTAVRLRGGLGLGRFPVVHGPHIGGGFLEHGAGFDERRWEALTGMLSAGEGRNS